MARTLVRVLNKPFALRCTSVIQAERSDLLFVFDLLLPISIFVTFLPRRFHLSLKPPSNVMLL